MKRKQPRWPPEDTETFPKEIPDLPLGDQTLVPGSSHQLGSRVPPGPCASPFLTLFWVLQLPDPASQPLDPALPQNPEGFICFSH